MSQDRSQDDSIGDAARRAEETAEALRRTGADVRETRERARRGYDESRAIAEHAREGLDDVRRVREQVRRTGPSDEDRAED
jgi:methyl-accepting chemotaxis protein